VGAEEVGEEGEERGREREERERRRRRKAWAGGGGGRAGGSLGERVQLVTFLFSEKQ
jgi:hypothetical protein